MLAYLKLFIWVHDKVSLIEPCYSDGPHLNAWSLTCPGQHSVVNLLWLSAPHVCLLCECAATWSVALSRLRVHVLDHSLRLRWQNPEHESLVLSQLLLACAHNPHEC